MLKCVLTSCLLLTCLFHSPANGQTASHGGGTDRIQLQVPVTASIRGRCGFQTAPAAAVDLGNLEAGFSREIPFVLRCNSPMRLAVTSRNGGLRAPGNPQPGTSGSLDYMVTVHAVGTGGTSVTASCLASALVATAAQSCSLRGTASASVGLRLPAESAGEQGSYLALYAAPTAGRVNLVASTEYADALVITLSPSA